MDVCAVQNATGLTFEICLCFLCTFFLCTFFICTSTDVDMDAFARSQLRASYTCLLAYR